MGGDEVVGDDVADVRAEIQTALQRFLARYSPDTEVRRAMQTELGYDPLLWRELAEQLGVAGLAIPERYGGIGLAVTELAVAFYGGSQSALCTLVVDHIVEYGVDAPRRRSDTYLAASRTGGRYSHRNGHTGFRIEILDFDGTAARLDR